MRSLAILATIAASSGIALADTNTWSSWESATTTVTYTLLHVTNETVTSTSYSHSATPHAMVNTTATWAAPATSTAAATIASYSTGAAVVHEANFAVAGLLGVGALAYGLF